VFKEGELDRGSVCANFAHTAEYGKVCSEAIVAESATVQIKGGKTLAYSFFMAHLCLWTKKYDLVFLGD